MRFLFLNQYGPPDPSPTARLLAELGENLQAAGHAVEIIAQPLGYIGRPARAGRMRRELAAAWAILRAGWKQPGGKPDVVLALSSPPGLPVIGAILARRHRAAFAHWAMDLYPELAVALGEIRAGGFAARLVGGLMRWAYRRASLVIALDEDMQRHLQAFCRAPVQVAAPWPAMTMENPANVAGTAKNGVWLYAGNLGRAHEWRTLLDAQGILERRGVEATLVIQGDGAARAEARACAESLGLRQCVWTGYVAEEELVPGLLAARVLIVTQRPETQGLLWPSKLALMLRLPRQILFVGPRDGAIAEGLRERGGAGVFEPGNAEGVADWVAGVLRDGAAGEGQAREGAASARAQVDALRGLLVGCGTASKSP